MAFLLSLAKLKAVISTFFAAMALPIASDNLLQFQYLALSAFHHEIIFCLQSKICSTRSPNGARQRTI
jgi:hypothetical protein